MFFILADNKEGKHMQLIDDSYFPLDISPQLYASQYGIEENDIWMATIKNLPTAIGSKTTLASSRNEETPLTTIAPLTKKYPTDSIDYNFDAAFGDAHEPKMINIVRNELNIGKISIDNHGQLYLCKTSNSNLTKPADLIVKLEVYGIA